MGKTRERKWAVRRPWDNIQSPQIFFNRYDLQEYKNTLILIITFILFSINCLSTRCPISRKSRIFLFHLNNPKISQNKVGPDWSTWYLCLLVSLAHCCLCWPRCLLCQRGTPQLPFTIQSFLDFHPLLYHCSPKHNHRCLRARELTKQLSGVMNSVHLYTFIHSVSIHLWESVHKHEKMAGRRNAKYW